MQAFFYFEHYTHACIEQTQLYFLECWQPDKHIGPNCWKAQLGNKINVDVDSPQYNNHMQCLSGLTQKIQTLTMAIMLLEKATPTSTTSTPTSCADAMTCN